VTTNFLGPILGNTPSFFGGFVDVNASSNVFGVLDTDTPFDFFNNLDAFLMPEEPDCSVDIEKEVREIKDPLDEWADADQCTDNDVPMISVPGGAMYRLIVTNTGINTLLANCVITDNQLGISQEIMPPPLVPGETVTLTGMDIPALFVTDRCEVAGELLNTADIICDCFDGEVDLGIDATDADDACINCVEEPICGDGIVGNTPGETCDPPTGFCTGFDIPRTACASDTDCPTGETCGGLVAPVDGGAADRTCRDSGGPDECTYCGDGIENNAEECDDGNDIDDDSCSNTCITNQPDIDIEKTTDGAPNGNPVDSDFDNEDSANGPGIPVLNPGDTVTWTYKVTNTGAVTIPEADVTVTDSVAGVNPVRVTPDFVGDDDNLLEPGEMWRYEAQGTVLDLEALSLGDPIVTGCSNVPVGSGPRNTYENTGTVTIPGDSDSDPSHYCNPEPQIEIEKTTDGAPNGNPVDSDFDNEDSANGPGIPVLNPGDTVTWTYKVTNTGAVTIPEADVTVTDSVAGVNPVRVTPDFMGDNDNLLEPGEMWRYVATGVVLDLAAEPLGDPIVTGCNNVPVGSGPRNTYENTGTVMVPGDMDSDPSHYCNEPICGDGIVGNTPGETCDPPGQPAGQPNECRGDCTFCGDGVLDAVEECDDGNNVDGDGCSANCTNEGICGTGTPGYWKNHPEDWPVNSIMVDGVLYPKDDAIFLMGKDGSGQKGNKCLTMYRSIVAAKLNILNGCTGSCVLDIIDSADEWMETYCVDPVIPMCLNKNQDNCLRVDADSSAWDIGEPLYWILDDYNNGLLCDPSRDCSDEPSDKLHNECMSISCSSGGGTEPPPPPPPPAGDCSDYGDQGTCNDDSACKWNKKQNICRSR
jgi:uncharacterized repeat protein (TIGR01451 family)